MKGLFASAVLLAATAQAGLVPVSSVRAILMLVGLRDYFHLTILLAGCLLDKRHRRHRVLCHRQHLHLYLGCLLDRARRVCRDHCC